MFHSAKLRRADRTLCRRPGRDLYLARRLPERLWPHLNPALGTPQPRWLASKPVRILPCHTLAAAARLGRSEYIIDRLGLDK